MKAIERELWALCRELTFREYGRNCFTCPSRNLQKQGLQCGHGYPKGALGARMKYDLRILRPQCFHCNINLGGMGTVFWRNLEKQIGKKQADAIYLECQRSKMGGTPARGYYLSLIEDYKKLCTINVSATQRVALTGMV